ncbi:MAG: heavy metal translocating P-type ATPase [Spirochaetales bacterium]
MTVPAQIRTSASLIKSFGVEGLFVVLTLITMVGGWFAARADASTLSAILYAIAFAGGGYFGVIASFQSLRERKIDIDLLMVLAAGGAAAVGAPFEGALLLFLFSLSNVLQNFAMDRTRNAIRALSALRPDTAIVLESADSQRGTDKPIKEIPVGAYLQVRPGDRIALDGVVVSGQSTVDQSSITGESLPVEKSVNHEVLSGTMNQEGELVVRVTKTSNESTLARVITLVEQAHESKATSQRFLETFEQYYAIVVILATVLAGILPPYLFGTAWDVSVYRAITLMVAASPCALIISTPASILSSIANGARNGILFKGGAYVEQAAGIEAIAFDKTGTLTEGRPHVSGVFPAEHVSENGLLAAAASLESKSEHVIAQAICEAANERGLAYRSPREFNSTSGIGIEGQVNGRNLLIGSPSLLTSVTVTAADHRLAALRKQIDELQEQTNTVIVVLEPAKDSDHSSNDPSSQTNAWSVMGLIALRDRIRPEAQRVIAELKAYGVRHIVMLTGDNRTTAEAIGREAGVDEVISELLPADKLTAVEEIEGRWGSTAMVGDGVNDAPALARAGLGIAMGAAGTDVALESADVVLLADDLERLPYLIALSRRTKRTLVTNITVALSLIGVMILGIYTIDLPLPLAVIGHEGGTVLVSLNGMRLLMFRRPRISPGASAHPANRADETTKAAA